MKEIKLTQGKIALVDDEDFEYLNQWKWCAKKERYTFYAIRNTPWVNGKHTTIPMHRVILNTSKGMETDHRDRNGLNNQRYNLRNVTNQENKFNTKAKGYSFDKLKQKFKAEIRLNGKSKYLGDFKTKSEARQAYLDAKKIYHIIRPKTVRTKIKVDKLLKQ